MHQQILRKIKLPQLLIILLQRADFFSSNNCYTQWSQLRHLYVEFVLKTKALPHTPTSLCHKLKPQRREKPKTAGYPADNPR